MVESFEVAELAENLSFEDDTEPSAPLLKYQPILHGVADLTSMDKIACIACHGKFLAVGTALGRVYIMDHEGFATENGVHSMHRGPVNQISISENGDYMASCGDDGRIVVYNVSDLNENEVLSMDEAVKSVAIAPDYSHSPVIAFGHSKLLLLTKGMFKRSKHGEVANANGFVNNIKWRGDILIWTDDMRVGVYDLRSHQHISYIQFSQQTATLYTRHVPCHINWCTDTCFLIGRGSSLRICQILERYVTPERRGSFSSSKGSIGGRSSSIHIPTESPDSPMGLANRYVELSYQVDVANSLVCGLSRHQTQLLALVVPNISLCSQSNTIPLELQLIQVDDFETTQAALKEPSFHREQQTWVTPRGKRGYADVHLDTVPGENTHYIATPTELICAKALTIDDHIDWLLAHGDFEQALQLISEQTKQLERHTLQSVGLDYVEHLLENGNFELAASVCGRVIAEKQKWEEMIHKFMRFGQLSSLVPFIPVGSKELPVLLSHAVYETILIDFMDRDPERFLDLLSIWCKRNLLDSFDALLRTLLERIDRQACLTGIVEPNVLEPGLRSLWQASALLYELVGSPDKALDILIQLRDPKVFELFDRRFTPTIDHRLIEALKERVDYFMQLNAPKAVSVLLDHVANIPLEHVIGQLEGQPEQLFHYLDGAYARYPKLVVPYITQLIQLYTRFRREKLLPLLRSTDSYRLSEALAICEQAKLVPETVYLLTRIGRRHDALQLIMTQGGDSISNTDNETDRTVEEQRQSAAAAAAIAYCCEEDALRSQFRLNFDATSSQPRSIFGVPVTNEDNRDDDEYQFDGSHDGELWQQVVLFAVDKPAFICALLQHAGSEGLDPRLLLRKISPDLSIPGLRDSLVKLMRNYKLQLELLRSCRRVLRSDASKLFERLLQQQARGICVQPGGFSSVSCGLCSNQLVCTRPGESDAKLRRPQADDTGPQSSDSCCLVFHCKHVTHSACVPPDDTGCPVCAKS